VRNTLLWVDWKISTREAETMRAFDSHFEVMRYTSLSTLHSQIEALKPSVLVFDFDFPNKVGLKALQEAKRTHLSIPVIMLTIQHSEALAVWAFRARVWDYFVKPISKREMERCFHSLKEMLAMRRAQPEPRTVSMPSGLIPDENRTRNRHGDSHLELAPIIDYVEKNYRGKLSSAEAAQLCGLTTFQLSRSFRETFGMTFQEYILRFRIRESCRLLTNSRAEISEIACLAGFNDPSYFGKVFRRYIGCSPSQYVSDDKIIAANPDSLLTMLEN
jgi:YesN/AraC family two-component response regulator